MQKINLTGLTEEELEQFAGENGEKAFRGRQLFSWLYERRVDNFGNMSNIYIYYTIYLTLFD